MDTLTSKEQKKNEKSGGGCDASEKLGRNRDKLNTALLVYTNASNALITAINDLCDDGWKELQPLVLRLVQFERTYNSVGITMGKELEGVEQTIKGIGEQHNLNKGASFARLDRLVANMVKAFSDKTPVLIPKVGGGSRTGLVGGLVTGGLQRNSSFELTRNRSESSSARPITPQALGKQDLGNAAAVAPAGGGDQGLSKKRWGFFGGGKMKGEGEDGDKGAKTRGARDRGGFGSFQNKEQTPWASTEKSTPKVPEPSPEGFGSGTFNSSVPKPSPQGVGAPALAPALLHAPAALGFAEFGHSGFADFCKGDDGGSSGGVDGFGDFGNFETFRANSNRPRQPKSDPPVQAPAPAPTPPSGPAPAPAARNGFDAFAGVGFPSFSDGFSNTSFAPIPAPAPTPAPIPELVLKPTPAPIPATVLFGSMGGGGGGDLSRQRNSSQGSRGSFGSIGGVSTPPSNTPSTAPPPPPQLNLGQPQAQATKLETGGNPFDDFSAINPPTPLGASANPFDF